MSKKLSTQQAAAPAGKKKAYAQAGVDVDLGNLVKSRIQKRVSSTHGPEVLGRIGGFGGLFRPDFKGMKEPVLVSSVDGVGTKLKIAFATGRHDTVGQDLVNHCIDDIAVLGARPLFFLDYIGAERLDPPVFEALLAGFSKACKAGGCALIGGETAQMPGMYHSGEYDLAGTIVGVVDRRKMIDGSRINPGDVIVGLPSNGLHTNGYSLARKVFFEQMGLSVESRLPKLTRPLGEELLKVHRNYQPLLASLPDGLIKGMAHITGGGLIDNLPRVLPDGCDAIIERRKWRVPPIFQLIQENGGVDPDEMYQVFNMGIGMALIVAERDLKETIALTKGRLIGRIEQGRRTVCLA
ncbi:MAG TPA: phosphoribosylformylglycinamidine cyclo-ligase [Chthoniobacteraceae bacterium]|nr:phosphoribosylformylglycinamidine cyclo-ligase [Chthoniobacteraceae bacterium]